MPIFSREEIEALLKKRGLFSNSSLLRTDDESTRGFDAKNAISHKRLIGGQCLGVSLKQSSVANDGRRLEIRVINDADESMNE
jgi:hypothetical protein